MNHTKHWLRAVAILFGCGGLCPAQISYGLVPAMVTAEFTPGKPFTQVLQLTNGTNAAVVMRGVALDFWYDAANPKVFAPAGTMPRSASDWIEFVPKVITIPAKGSADVTLVITPAESASGGYYSVAFLETRPELAEPAGNGRKALYTNVRLGALVMLTAAGTQHFALEAGSPVVTPPTETEALSVALEARNTGNVHAFPAISMIVFDAAGAVRAKATSEPKRLLPGQTQNLTVRSAEQFEPGEYEALINVVFGADQPLTRSVRFRAGGGAAPSRVNSAGTTAELH